MKIVMVLGALALAWYLVANAGPCHPTKVGQTYISTCYGPVIR